MKQWRTEGRGTQSYIFHFHSFVLKNIYLFYLHISKKYIYKVLFRVISFHSIWKIYREFTLSLSNTGYTSGVTVLQFFSRVGVHVEYLLCRWWWMMMIKNRLKISTVLFLPSINSLFIFFHFFSSFLFFTSLLFEVFLSRSIYKKNQNHPSLHLAYRIIISGFNNI